MMRERGLALAGVIGPIWFTTLVVLQGLLLPDYSHIGLPISALAAWPAAVLLMFVAVGFFAIDDRAPLHAWAGLLQRVLCAVWFTCLIVLALRLRSGRREIHRSRGLPPR